MKLPGGKEFQYVEPFRHNSGVCRTDGRTEFPHQYGDVDARQWMHWTQLKRCRHLASWFESLSISQPHSHFSRLLFRHWDQLTVDFLRELECRTSSKFQEERQTAYLFQRLSVIV